MGPITIFDKSALQSLNVDEAVWLDAFLMANITPMFYVETLADLEKDVRAGKTPEQVVGRLAEKTPTRGAPNVHHRTLMLSELAGGRPLEMDGRPVIAGGTTKRAPDHKTSIEFDQFPETTALNRWRDAQFMDIERQAAKAWRSQLAQIQHDQKIAILKNIFPAGFEVSNLAELKSFLDDFCIGGSRQIVQFAMEVLDLPTEERPKVMSRWEAAGSPRLIDFAPYTTHLFKVDALYYLGIDRGFISGERASNKVDMAYLYYLPFTMVFTSGDRLHARTAPLFLRSDQSFVPAADLKNALAELDKHFDELPEEIKQLGVMQFAGYPPADLNNTVTELWDKHMQSGWRNISRNQEAARTKPRDREADRKLIEDINAKQRASIPLSGSEAALSADEVQRVVLTRETPVQRGKWRMVSPEVERLARARQENPDVS